MKLPNEFIIFDTEYTSWEGSLKRNWSNKNEYKELVAIGALHVSIKKNKMEIKNKLKILFIPKINSKLSNYFVNLTGITNQDIKNEGYTFIKGMDLFLNFTNNLPIYSYGNDYEIIEENLNLYDINLDINKDKFLDIVPFFRSFNIDTKKYTSGEIHRHFNIIIDNIKVHDPLFDCISMFKTIEYLIKIEQNNKNNKI